LKYQKEFSFLFKRVVCAPTCGNARRRPQWASGI